MHSADQKALDVMMDVCPIWSGLELARDVIPMAEQVILHAGPPLSPNRMAKAVSNSVVMAMLFEGWAADVQQAQEMLRSGEVALRPAQDFGVVVPLASVLSPSMSVHVVTDRNNSDIRAFSTINGGMQHALRLGLSNDQVLQHLRWLNGPFSETLRKSIPVDGVPLIPLADHGLNQGDDCHGRTIAATAKLLDEIKVGLSSYAGGESAIQYINESPPFFLNLWMASTKCMMSAAKDVAASSVITAIGGNGIDFGLQLSGLTGRWFTVPAAPPAAIYADGFSEQDALGAIGDSAVVDALGLGAMVVNLAPEQQKGLGPVLPDDARDLPQRLLGRRHEAFEQSGILFGLPARRIIQLQTSLIISLGVIDVDGENGRVGGGIYRPPLAVFSQACAALDL